MTAPAGRADRDVQDALAAIDRLIHRYHLLSPEDGLKAARIVTNDPAFEWPQPAPAPAPPAPAAPAPAPAAAAPTEGAPPASGPEGAPPS